MFPPSSDGAFQTRFKELLDTGVTVKPVGALGAASVVADALFDGLLVPAEFNAETLYA
jgi:hypothetical protein